MRIPVFQAIAVAALCVAFGPAFGGTTLSYGAGSAVISIDRSTAFDDLDFAHNGTPLSDYQSGGLYIKTNGNSYYGDNSSGQVGIDGVIVPNSPYLNPFHLTSPSGPGDSYINIGGGFYFPYDGAFGNTDWITVQTTDGKKIYALEFLYGNGWSNGDVYGTMPWGNSSAVLEWQTYNGGALVSSGAESLSIGTVVGFFDPDGFDQLRVRATGNSVPADLQELAMDNLEVQTTAVPVYSISTSSSPSNGGITSGDGTYYGGANVTVVANPNIGYVFMDWTENGTEVSTSSSFSFTAAADRHLLANFSPSAILFIRGNANADGATDISDGVAILGYLFLGATNVPCEQAADANDDGALDVSDGIYVLSFLFTGGGAIPPPVGTCGVDPAGHALPCGSYPLCL